MLNAAVTLLAAASEAGHEETSKTLFYVAGAMLAAFALLVSAMGISRRDSFPPSTGAARAVMGLAAVLVVFTMAASVITG